MKEIKRDTKGRFKQNGPGPIQPGEVRQPHPTISYRDNKGRLLPGSNIGGKGYVPAIRQDLNKALLEAVTPDEIARLGRELYALCMNESVPHKERQDYMNLFFNRFLGRPIKELILSEEKHTTNVHVDLTKLTTEELQTYLSLSSKVNPVIDVEPARLAYLGGNETSVS